METTCYSIQPRLLLSFRELEFPAMASQITGTLKSRLLSCLLLNLLTVSCLPNTIFVPEGITTLLSTLTHPDLSHWENVSRPAGLPVTTGT